MQLVLMQCMKTSSMHIEFF